MKYRQAWYSDVILWNMDQNYIKELAQYRGITFIGLCYQLQVLTITIHNIPEKLNLLKSMCYYLFQKMFVQWLVIVYDLIDNLDKFHSVYCVLFHFLRSEILVGTFTFMFR